MEKIDLHIHTAYSDGNPSINKAIKTAREKNLTYLAITDHFTTSWKQSIIDTVNFENFGQYIAGIKKERESARFNCLVGIEIDMGSNWADIKRFPFNQFELLLFEYVDSIVTLKRLCELIQELEIKPIKALAHNSYVKMANMEMFSSLLVENNIYFELNSRYITHPDNNLITRLKILKDHGITFTIGSDAHIESRIGDTKAAVAILEKIDGFENVIDLSFVKFNL
ncbi:MAG: PHP domain-containing protein [Candidatus Helarchaeota archaeon]|nr:PHP domain-containing protein [Candidatus Helarchaeota archaeon]